MPVDPHEKVTFVRLNELARRKRKPSNPLRYLRPDVVEVQTDLLVKLTTCRLAIVLTGFKTSTRSSPELLPSMRSDFGLEPEQKDLVATIHHEEPGRWTLLH
jgi:hypothetical protein